jgi:hypothetical protein
MSPKESWRWPTGRSRHDDPVWRKLRTPRTYTKASASPFPLGVPQQVTFDLLPTSVLFRPGDRISGTPAGPSFVQLPVAG